MAGASRVEADAPEMERFAGELARFNQDLYSLMQRLNGQFSRLGDSWRDPAYDQFAREMQQTSAALRQLMTASEQYSVFLKRKDDAHALFDGDGASKLGHNRAYLSSEETGAMQKFRPYGIPEDAWLEETTAAIRARSGSGVTSEAT